VPVGAAPDPHQCPPPPEKPRRVLDLVGLALSGGGIRSASFNLGVLQGLASRNALWMFDLLSTVSGGGFIGSWWSAWLSRQGRQPREVFPQNEELEPQRRVDTAVLLGGFGQKAPPASIPDGSLLPRRDDPIHFVRLFSNYLTPKKGAFSPDTWRLIAFLVRGLLFTWTALLPLLLAAIIAGQAFYLLDRDVAQAFICPAPPGAQVAASDAVKVSTYCRDYDQKAGGAASWSKRLEFLKRPFLLLLTAYATLALLWLAYSSARVRLSLFAFVVLLAVGLLIIVPVFRETESAGMPWGVMIAAFVTILLHAGHSLAARLDAADAAEKAAVPGIKVRTTTADQRAWLTQQQAWLLKVGTVAGLLLLIAGFGHDVMWLLFSGGDSVMGRALARAGGWGGLFLAVGSSVYTALKAAPLTEGAAPQTPGRLSRLVTSVAPPLVLLMLGLGFALLSHHLLVRTMILSNNVLVLANGLVWLAVLEVVFAVYESYNDPASPPDEGHLSWKRLVPDPILRLIGRPDLAGSPRPWWAFFSPRGWVRAGVGATIGVILLLAQNRSWSGLGRPIGTFTTTPVAVLILLAAAAITFWPRKSRVALGSARPAVLLVIACLTAALTLLGNHTLVTRLQSDALLAALLWIGLLTGAVIGIGWLADPNLLSMHGFYKARLTRAYLGASNATRGNSEITDAVPGDDIKLTDLWNPHIGAPYHIVNTTLSLVGGSDLAMSQRSAENFILSRYHCGSARAGYRCTAEYMNGELSLGTAAAISGAAVSPNMGSKSPSASLALLMSLLNVRLGFWAPTPSGRRWVEPHARLWPFYLLRETLSNTGTLGTYCYLTDGGHFDNTGLYALVERGCRYIVVCDCGADPDRGFEDMGVAIRRCRIDFGAEIVLSIHEFVPSEQQRTTNTHVVRGTITYQRAHFDMLRFPEDADTEGVVIWIKPSVTALNSVDVQQYHRAHPDFPQQSTAEQWYDESQFESYRCLGFDSACEAFDLIPEASIGRFPGIPQWFGVTAAPVGAGPGPLAS
jgi:hypothetical protein